MDVERTSRVNFSRGLDVEKINYLALYGTVHCSESIVPDRPALRSATTIVDQFVVVNCHVGPPLIMSRFFEQMSD
jgi:hypothetical protein